MNANPQIDPLAALYTRLHAALGDSPVTLHVRRREDGSVKVNLTVLGTREHCTRALAEADTKLHDATHHGPNRLHMWHEGSDIRLLDAKDASSGYVGVAHYEVRL